LITRGRAANSAEYAIGQDLEFEDRLDARSTPAEEPGVLL